MAETEAFQIGWINKNTWRQQEIPGPSDCGVAERTSAIGLDLVRHKVRYEASVKTLQTDFSIGKGTVIRCEQQASDFPAWFINGNLIESGASALSSYYVPAFSGKGEWCVSYVELFL